MYNVFKFEEMSDIISETVRGINKSRKTQDSDFFLDPGKSISRLQGINNIFRSMHGVVTDCISADTA